MNRHLPQGMKPRPLEFVQERRQSRIKILSSLPHWLNPWQLIRNCSITLCLLWQTDENGANKDAIYLRARIRRFLCVIQVFIWFFMRSWWATSTFVLNLKTWLLTWCPQNHRNSIHDVTYRPPWRVPLLKYTKKNEQTKEATTSLLSRKRSQFDNWSPNRPRSSNNISHASCGISPLKHRR